MAVGADGVCSVMRRFVAPDHPAALYAGYMLWRGLVREAEVPGGLDGRGRNLELYGAPGAQLVVYGAPGADGRADPGHRRVSFAWYDASRTELLRETGCLEGDAVVASLAVLGPLLPVHRVTSHPADERPGGRDPRSTTARFERAPCICAPHVCSWWA